MFAGIDLVSVLIALAVFGAIYYLLTLIPMGEPFPTIIKVVLIVAAIIWLAQNFL
jgi:hypothetical protein